MKLQKIVISCDSNPDYLDFWPIVSKQWYSLMGIRPTLCYIGNDEHHLNRKYGEVIEYPLIDGIPPALQGQWARFFQATQYDDAIVTLTDIDLLPFGFNALVPLLDILDDDKYVHTSWTFNERKRFSACYHFAQSKLLKEVWQMPNCWEESLQMIVRSRYAEFDGKKYNFGLDELYTTEKMQAYNDQSVFFHILSFSNEDSISRRLWHYDLDLLKDNKYLIVNMPRPYKKYSFLHYGILNQIPIPKLLNTLFKAVKYLRQTRPLGTRLWYRLIYPLYLNGLNYYFRYKKSSNA